MIYALDTNIVIYMINDNETVKERAEYLMISGSELVIPQVADYEVRRGFLYKDPNEMMPVYECFVDMCRIQKFPRRAWYRAAEIYAQLRRKSITVEDADILIAAPV